MFDFLKKRREGGFKPSNRSEEFALLKSKNDFVEQELKIERGISREKEREKKLKSEEFGNSPAGKVWGAIKENFKPPKKGKGGLRIGINPDYLKR